MTLLPMGSHHAPRRTVAVLGSRSPLPEAVPHGHSPQGLSARRLGGIAALGCAMATELSPGRLEIAMGESVILIVPTSIGARSKMYAVIAVIEHMAASEGRHLMTPPPVASYS